MFPGGGCKKAFPAARCALRGKGFAWASSQYRLLATAAGQAEAADASLERRSVDAYDPVDLVILVYIPERTVIGGVNVHRRVIAPTGTGRQLHTGSIDNGALTQGHLARRVAGRPPGVADSRTDIHSIDDTVAEGHVAGVIHGDATHPTMHAVIRSIGALLEDGVLTVGPPDLVPAHARHAGESLDRLVGHQSFIGAEVAVGQTPGRALPVGQDVEEPAPIGDPGLGEAVSGARRLGTGDYAAREDRV